MAPASSINIHSIERERHAVKERIRFDCSAPYVDGAGFTPYFGKRLIIPGVVPCGCESWDIRERRPISRASTDRM